MNVTARIHEFHLVLQNVMFLDAWSPRCRLNRDCFLEYGPFPKNFRMSFTAIHNYVISDENPLMKRLIQWDKHLILFRFSKQMSARGGISHMNSHCLTFPLKLDIHSGCKHPGRKECCSFPNNLGQQGCETHLRCALLIKVVALNTLLASTTSCLFVLALAKLRIRRYDLGKGMSGIMCGLVSISASAGVVCPWAAMVIYGGMERKDGHFRHIRNKNQVSFGPFHHSSKSSFEITFIKHTCNTHTHNGGFHL
jgi:hypothetical protein